MRSIQDMKRMKYGNKRTELDGISFHSKREAARYQELKISLKVGEIESLELQPRFPMIVDGYKICTYIADFRYLEQGKVIVEDVKGFLTDVYKLKAKLFQALYPQYIFRETR
jgi:hypothetical protein